jgi:hypothetical protein
MEIGHESFRTGSSHACDFRIDTKIRVPDALRHGQKYRSEEANSRWTRSRVRLGFTRNLISTTGGSVGVLVTSLRASLSPERSTRTNGVSVQTESYFSVGKFIFRRPRSVLTITFNVYVTRMRVDRITLTLY